MLRPSFVPPPAIRALRDLTRYRVDLLAVRTAEKQRVEKLLEDALIKLSVVARSSAAASPYSATLHSHTASSRSVFGRPGRCLTSWALTSQVLKRSSSR